MDAKVRATRERYAEDNVHVLDWIQFDGDNFRSLAITLGDDPCE